LWGKQEQAAYNARPDLEVHALHCLL